MLYSLRVRLLLTLIVVVFVAVGTVALLASRVSASELQRYVNLDLQRNQRVIDTLVRAYRQGPGDPTTMAQQLGQSFDERVLLVDGAGVVQADSQGELVGQSFDCAATLAAIVVSLGGAACFEQPFTAGAAFGQSESVPAGAGDLLFWSAPASQTIELATAPPELALLHSEVTALQLGADAQAPGRLVLGVGALQPAGAEFPAISIRRTRGPSADPIEAGFVSAVNRSLLLAAGVAGLVALALTAALSRGILGPIEALTAAARAMEQGDLSQRVRVRSRDELGVLAHAFNAMADGLARIEQLRRQLVTDVAHELRTPLTNIRGYLEALRDGVAAPTPELIGSLHDEALLLNRLVNDLQDLALAEAGQLRLDRRPVALAPLVEQAVGALGPALAEKQLAIGTELPPDLPEVYADAERVGQVLRNLLANAITHTPMGGAITVRASVESGGSRREEGGGRREDSATPSSILHPQPFILVQVADTGPGIAPEQLGLVFERFFRADRSRARATGGAGLGLAIVRQLVEAHGGQAWAESAPGQGATLLFTLPFRA
jgi:signal transduction histidine kinase